MRTNKEIKRAINEVSIMPNPAVWIIRLVLLLSIVHSNQREFANQYNPRV